MKLESQQYDTSVSLATNWNTVSKTFTFSSDVLQVVDLNTQFAAPGWSGWSAHYVSALTISGTQVSVSLTFRGSASYTPGYYSINICANLEE